MEQDHIDRAAEAAFQRGRIAEDEIRWADAAEHYAKAARLAPSYDNLFKAREFAWRAGDFSRAAGFGADLVRVAREEFGDGSEKLATALNEHALTLHFQGHYKEAEPLFRQALEIDAATIGTAHPGYAIDLNNLAELLRDTGRYDEAEPLYRQALEIDAATIGTAHPGYAIDLNNLAGLLQAMGRYDEAAPLYAQMMPILREKLGDRHPDTKTCAGNYARFLRAHLPDDPALAELEAVFGAGIGR